MSYLDDIRLKTALKLLRLRANKTLEAKALSWLTIGFSFGRSIPQKIFKHFDNIKYYLIDLTNKLADFSQ